VGIRTRLFRQFGQPAGVGGRLAGWIMGRRPSNVARSRWAVELLELGPEDRLLEIGCGPGVALAAAAMLGSSVVGVDRSAVMVAQARRRNRRAIRAGQIELYVAPVEHLPDLGAPFDKALAVNTVGYWSDPVAGVAAVRRRLRPGGTFAMVSQPRRPGATATDSARAGTELVDLLAASGFGEVRLETLDLDPPAVCALARKPSTTGR
jgi:SAM-dependent methyltransferase